MATVTTSIGTNTSIDTETPSGGSGSNPYTVTFGTDPTGVSVGDSVHFDNGMGTVYVYLVTGISGSNYTLKWISGGMGATNPYGIVDMSYSQASGVFKRTYSTISAWESDLDNTSYYSSSDHAVGEAYDDSVFDEYIVIDSGGTVGLSSVKLTVPESERHDGTAGTGSRVAYTGSESSSFRIRRSQCTVEWMELDLTSAGSAVSAGLNLGTNSTQDVYAKHNIIHGLTTQSTHIHGIYIWGTGDSSNTRYVTNNLVYRRDNSSTTKEASGITVSSGNWGVYLYGNTVYYVKATGGGDQAFCFSIHDTDTFIKNNIAARPDAISASYEKCFGESGFAGSTHDYNLSTDSTATGTNSVTGEAYGDLFLNDTGGNEDLHLKTGADAIGAGVDLGTSPTGVNIDIDGRDRDSEGDTWDIGADQTEPAVTPVTPSDQASITATAHVKFHAVKPANAGITGTAHADFHAVIPANAGITVTAIPGPYVVTTSHASVTASAQPNAVKFVVAPPHAGITATAVDNLSEIQPAPATITATAYYPFIVVPVESPATITASAHNDWLVIMPLPADITATAVDNFREYTPAPATITSSVFGTYVIKDMVITTLDVYTRNYSQIALYQKTNGHIYKKAGGFDLPAPSTPPTTLVTGMLAYDMTGGTDVLIYQDGTGHLKVKRSIS